MAVLPVVRYMLLCDDWGMDPENPQRLNIYGLLSTLNSVDDPPFPLLHREFCVLILLTEGRGTSECSIRCIFEETGELIFETPRRVVTFGNDPLALIGMPFRLVNLFFPRAGLYSVQFWYNNLKVEERPLRLR